MLGDEQQYVAAEIDADTESGRLRLLELCRDRGTSSRLNRLGVSPGWRCLEVGAGHGSIARWLAERVGPAGSVVAADLEPRFLTDMPSGVDVRRLDIRHDDLEADSFDLIHCRALLMHVADPMAAMARMIVALRPGGWFLFEEGDYGLWNYGGHADASRLNELVTRVLGKLAEAKIAHPWLGRDLPGLALASGLEVHGSEVETRVTRPGEADYEFERATLLATAPVMIKIGVYTETDADLIQSLKDHRDTVITTVSLVAVWGRKPL